MTDHLTMIEVLAIHNDQIERFGGAEGVRDLGLLEAALFRPQTGYYADLIEEAAALWESLAQNHPFVDGNKRVGHAALETFLVLNGSELGASIDDAERVILGVAAGEVDRDRFASWIKHCLQPLDS